MKEKRTIQWKTGLGTIMLGLTDGVKVWRMDGCPCIPPKGEIKEASEYFLNEFCLSGKWEFSEK